MSSKPFFIKITGKKGGRVYFFSFLFHKRNKKEDFVLRYSEDEFPRDESFEIELDDTPAGLLDKNYNIVHIASNEERTPGKKFICHFPGKDYDEALDIAQYWVKFIISYMEGENMNADKHVVMAFPLDEILKISFRKSKSLIT
ncbi:MAG: hypothetical protein QG583_896 [Patescibacteria group bacterium]|nr:hypothetical protein [Patescibacteria group bacterium]